MHINVATIYNEHIKTSKEFVLKAGGSFEKQYGLIGVKAGDLVTFAS